MTLLSKNLFAGNPAVTAIVKDKLKYQFGRKDTTGTCPSRTFPDFTLNPTGYLRKKKNFANLTHSQAVALLGEVICKDIIFKV